jgi:hypothetical protein
MRPTRTGTTYVVALFEDPVVASQASRELLDIGFPRDTLSVMSAMPYPEGAFPLDHGRSRVPFFSIAGALGGLMVGLLFAVGTALDYPLVTGGMPVVSLPTVAVILYEFTMLGTVVMTLLGLLFFARLLRRTPPSYAPQINDGMVGVGVRCGTPERASVAERMLNAAGAREVIRRGAH